MNNYKRVVSLFLKIACRDAVFSRPISFISHYAMQADGTVGIEKRQGSCWSAEWGLVLELHYSRSQAKGAWGTPCLSEPLHKHGELAHWLAEAAAGE